MINSIHARHRREHLRLGPLGTNIDVFAQHLEERGYARWTVQEKIWVVAGFSRWLQSEKRGVENLDEQVVSEFLRYRRRKGLSRHGAAPALRDLLRHLRDAGIIPCARGPESSPLHDIEVCFARYLTEERGLAQPTIDNRDRGRPHSLRPLTPPGIRNRTRRFI